jgi:glutaryl-CoA dehydrogenase
MVLSKSLCCKVSPFIEKHYREGIFPIDLVKKMDELGLLGSTLPANYGCPELGSVAFGSDITGFDAFN